MTDKPVTGAVTETPQAEPDTLVLGTAEQAWLRNQQRKHGETTSKYIVHQGQRERTRRLRRRAS